MDEPTESSPQQSGPGPELEPMPRDRRFIVRLGLALLVGLIAAAFIAIRLKSAAAGCGSGLIRPGGSVIPDDPQRSTP